MTDLVSLGASCEANGHPTSCTEPAPGTVQQTTAHSVTVTNGGGSTSQLATVADADMHFNSHAHSTDVDGNCVDLQTHDIDPDSAKASSSLTINGSPLYVVDTAVTSDPGSGGDVDIIDAGDNQSLTES